MITRETADPCPDFAPLLIAAVLLWSAGLGAAHDDGPGGRGEGSVTAEGSTAPSPVLATGQSCAIAIGFTPSAPGIRRTTLLESNALTSPDPADLIGTSGVLFFDGFELG